MEQPATRRGRPPTVSREDVIDASLRLIERVGVKRFTMRKLADELNTAKMTPYYHIGDKENLLELAANAMFDQLDLPEPDAARWDEQLRDANLAFRALLRRYSGMAAYATNREVAGGWRFTLWYIDLMRVAGFDGETAAGALPVFRGLVVADLDEAYRRTRTRSRKQSRSPAPPDRDLNVWEATFWKALDGGPEVMFERGLEHAIQGLHRQLDSQVETLRG
ncbi:MAG: TetR/AcrR family transcriptional regulator C-terminal domain-containing protein [Acidimicrobiia bacterium]